MNELKKTSENLFENNNLEFICKTNVKTRKLGLVYLNPETERRFKVMMELDQRGWNSREISEFLNKIGVKPQRTGHFTKELVWVTIKKLKVRQNKENVIEQFGTEWTVRISQ